MASNTRASPGGVPASAKAALATPAASSASKSRRPAPPRQWPFWAFASVVLPVLFALGYISVHLHYQLPEPRAAEFSPLGEPVFSEVTAMRYIRDLAEYADGTPKYRIVGTKEMVETDNYILEQIAAIREEVVKRHPTGDMQIEVFHQVSPGRVASRESVHLADAEDGIGSDRRRHSCELRSLDPNSADGTGLTRLAAALRLYGQESLEKGARATMGGCKTGSR